jgi:CheY-like chemotaxis protein
MYAPNYASAAFDDQTVDSRSREQFYTGAIAGATALIVEDDPRSAMALTALLERGRLNVVAATTGPGALDTLDERDDVEIVLMDIMMPAMDGCETISRIRRKPRFADLPIIAVTGMDDTERPRCLASGASDFVRKPIDSAVLLMAIGTWLMPLGTGPAKNLRV